MRAFVLLVTLFVATAAAADVVCRTRKGAVVMRTSCRKREHAVTLPIDAPKGPPGDAGSAAAAPVRVVDANGAPVGIYAEPGTENHATFVLFEYASGFAFLEASALGVHRSGSLYFESADCSGDALLPHETTSFVRQGIVLGATAYAPGDPVAMHQTGSREYDPFGASCTPAVTLPNGRCCMTTATSLDAGHAVTLLDVSAFAPPLRLEP